MSAHEEAPVVNALLKLCGDLGVTTLVQVGAGDGYEADFIRASIGCRAVCIEGDSRQTAITADIEWHQQVIGATDGTMPFYIHSVPNLSSQLPRGDNGEQMVELPQKRLDTFCEEHSIVPDGLIVDVEGTALDVLEGCGILLDGLKIVYAECQVQDARTGGRLVGEADSLLAAHGMTQHQGLPSYSVGAQGNYTWVRP